MTMAQRLMTSCSAEPAASRHTPYAAATATFAAAGTVVTEISTPTSEPDFRAVIESMPATPASRPITQESASGRQMKSVSGRSASSISRPTSPAAVSAQVLSTVTTMATRKPATRA